MAKAEKNAESLKNLIPFVKGKSGNPKGREPGQRNYATIYRAALEKIATTKGMTPEQVEELMEQTGLNKALEGDYKFFQDIRDRIHGKPSQAVELTGKDGAPIEQSITVSFVEADAKD